MFMVQSILWPNDSAVPLFDTTTTHFRAIATAIILYVVLVGFVAYPTAAQTSVLTYHNDNQRTGQYLTETVLTPANVNSATFGKIFSFPTVGNIYAQPLYMSAVTVTGKGTFNTVFVATENDSVYAFDADGIVTTPLWKQSFLDTAHGITSVPESDVVAQ